MARRKAANGVNVSALESGFARLWGIVLPNEPKPVTQYVFHETRKWRLDFAWPDVKVAVEIQGGTWTGGRHTRGKGYQSDCDKANAALALGWQLMRFTADDLNKRPVQTVELVQRVIAKRREPLTN